MEKDLKTMIVQCYEMCDCIEENGVIKKELQTTLRENLRREFLNFVIYLSMLDADFAGAEEEFINDVLGFHIKADTVKDLKLQRKLTENYYGAQIPLVVKYFVLADAGKKIRGTYTGIKKQNI